MFDVGAHASFVLRDLAIKPPQAASPGSKTMLRITAPASEMDLIADVHSIGGATNNTTGIDISGVSSTSAVRGIIRDCVLDFEDGGGGENPGNNIKIDGQPWAIYGTSVTARVTAVHLLNADGFVFVGNKVVVLGSVSGSALSLTNVTDSVFVGNELDGNSSAVVLVAGTGNKRNLFVGNRMSGGSSVGQTVNWSNDTDNMHNVFVGTLIQSCGGAGTGLLPTPTIANNYAWHTVSLDSDDPSDGNHQPGAHSHNATDISIADSGNFYTGTNVEAALQELGGPLRVEVNDSLLASSVRTLDFDGTLLDAVESPAGEVNVSVDLPSLDERIRDVIGTALVAGTNVTITVNDSADTITVSATGGGDGVPSGVVSPYAGSSAPTGWLLCDGSAVSRTTYADLFAVIGTTYGPGDGSTTFNLPDLRGRVPVALDNMGGTDAGRLSVPNTLGGSGGSQTHTLTGAEMPGHAHGSGTLQTSSVAAHTHGPTSGLSFVLGDAATSHRYTNADANNIDHSPLGPWDLALSSATASAGGHSHTVTGSTSFAGEDGAHNNMQPYLLLNYIIKT